MKLISKVFIFLFFFTLCLMSFDVCLTRAQQDTANIDKDIQEAKSALLDYLEAGNNQDLDAIMKKISPNYSEFMQGINVDYGLFKQRMEYYISESKKCCLDEAIANFTFFDTPTIKDGKAVLPCEYENTFLDINTMERNSQRRKRVFTLIKENDEWKIINIERIS